MNACTEQLERDVDEYQRVRGGGLQASQAQHALCDRDPVDDGVPEAGEDTVLGDDDARPQELRERHRGRVVRVAPVLPRHLRVDPQNVPGLRGQVVADLEVDHPKGGQDLLIEYAARLTFRRVEVCGHFGQVFVGFAGDVRGDVWGGTAGDGQRGDPVLPTAVLGQGAGFDQQRVGVEDGQQHPPVQHHRVQRRSGGDQRWRCCIGRVGCHGSSVVNATDIRAGFSGPDRLSDARRSSVGARPYAPRWRGWTTPRCRPRAALRSWRQQACY
ncbi:hypothetical protein [Streptomyces sp. NPDC006446]|uniref:hypothetical protein n=1 Tax=Streptomyces sp. NPDC006446 TaxID=3154301 RepID=UPI0033A6D23A